MNVFHVGDYILDKKKIGRGSFSKIYKGWHKETDQVVAVKRIEVDDIKKVSKNIKREIKVMKQLKHPNIVELYDVIYDYKEGFIYLVMEYCAKGDFNAFLGKRPLKEKYAKRYFRQLRDGLQYLLKNNVMHRDLKPHNILLTELNEVKLSDFGFARFFESNKLVETMCGSPMYMGPEIMKYKCYTNKSDLWSVGIILYEALTGHPPFNSKTFYDLIKHIEKRRIMIPSNIKLSKECEHLIYALLKKNPNQRISWEAFFRHPWFGDHHLIRENQLLEISMNPMHSMHDLDELSPNLLYEESDEETENDDEQTETNDEGSDEGDDEYFECRSRLRPSKPIPSKPIPVPVMDDYLVVGKQSPQFMDLREGSYVIVSSPGQHVMRSDNSPSLMNHVKGYIHSSISLLKDSVNYIRGNHSI